MDPTDMDPTDQEFRSGKVIFGADEGPIRVKGGSVFVDTEDEWVSAGGGKFKLKNKDNPKRKFWSVRVFVDGVPSNQYNGRIVEIEVNPVAGRGDAKKFECQVKGGIRVTPDTVIALKGTRLEVTDFFITTVRIKESLDPKEFGPFTPVTSKLVEVVLTAQGD
jgi:hypothetical protein